MLFKSLMIIICVVFGCTFCEFLLQNIKCKRGNNASLTCDFIPNNIPEGISDVYLNLDSTRKHIELSNSTFHSKSWSQVQLLQLEWRGTSNESDVQLLNDCFKRLEGLKELRLHVNCHLVIMPNAFVGLDLVHTLDMSDSVRISMDEFISALNGSNKLPGLKNIILSRFGLYGDPVVINETFAAVIPPRKVSKIDLSRTQIYELNVGVIVKDLRYLEMVNGSYSIISNIVRFDSTQNDFKHLKTVDISHTILPKSQMVVPPGKNKLQNFTYKYSDIDDYRKHLLTLSFTPETLYLNGIVPAFSTIWLFNCSVEMDRDPHFLTKTLIARQNNLKRLDVKLKCDSFQKPFENIDISDNGLEFFHPSFFLCAPNLTIIDMSKNKLAKMAEENIQLFETMFSGNKALKKIYLSSNEIENLPSKIFEKSSNVEVIDLSQNKLEQVHFSLKELHKLKTLDLQGNNIRLLDSISISHLNAISDHNKVGNHHLSIILISNPFSCNECNSESTIKWLISTHFVDISSQNLTCVNEDGQKELIGGSTLDKVQKICERKTLIISTTVPLGVTLMILGIVLLMIYRRRQAANKTRNRKNVIDRLREGEGIYKFAVFLVFSHEDHEFVESNVLNPLNETLQLMTGVDRELVCTGDKHFRPGFYVHNESYRCLDMAPVIIVIASNNFCDSEYCRSELDQAYIKRKPIVLMFIEQVDVDLMLPTLRELYRKNVRILWTYERGEYVLKTTWENVCTSILDLMK